MSKKIYNERCKLIKRLLDTIPTEDSLREGLVKTPDRVARMYNEIFGGYEKDIDSLFNATFSTDNNEMVIIKDIEYFSHCEHHMVPFFGKVHIAYIPDDKVLGLSKFGRLVDIFSKRLQIQEQMTHQIAEAIQTRLNPKGLAVVVTGKHLCYDDKTEILTDKGWKLFSDLDKTEKVVQVNPTTLEMSFTLPTSYIKLPFKGDLVKINSTCSDLVVTPEHRMIAKSEWDFYKTNKDWKIVEAETLLNSYNVLPRTPLVWKGEKLNSMFGIEGDLFVQFMGWYISEGSCSLTRGRKVVRITQKKEEGKSKIRNLLTSMGVSFSEVPSGKDGKVNFTLTGQFLQEIFDYLMSLGKSGDKFIPEEIKNSTPTQLELFLDSYIEGDGHRKQSGRIHFVSKSIKLIEDIQEICLRLGIGANIMSNKHRIETSKNYYKLSPSNIQKVPYEGFVYCVSVPDTLLVVRRNGKTTVSGNCMVMRGVKKIKSTTITSSVKGVLLENSTARAEFLNLLDLND